MHDGMDSEWQRVNRPQPEWLTGARPMGLRVRFNQPQSRRVIPEDLNERGVLAHFGVPPRRIYIRLTFVGGLFPAGHSDNEESQWRPDLSCATFSKRYIED